MGDTAQMKFFPLALCLLSLATSGPARGAAESCPALFAGGQPPALVNPRLAARTILLCNDSYASLASGVTRGALWSAEHPTAASLASARTTPRQGVFHAEGRLSPGERAELQDYRRSGYDRGHMTPSGDMPGGTPQQQSFSLANMVPQTPELNRGVWSAIEDRVRRLAERRGELFVVTGPAYEEARIDAIGPGGVLVPTSTWKAVHDPATGGTGAYVCSNTAAPTCRTVPVAAIEALAGIDPFPALPAWRKASMMPLPEPGGSAYGRAGRGRRALREPESVFDR